MGSWFQTLQLVSRIHCLQRPIGCKEHRDRRMWCMKAAEFMKPKKQKKGGTENKENTCQVPESKESCLVCQCFQVKCCSVANAAGWLCSSDTSHLLQVAHNTEGSSCTLHSVAQLFYISKGGKILKEKNQWSNS